MKKGYIDRWIDISACKNLLFFAQEIEEMIFDYSIPSHRLPTLNSHYLCKDAISTIEDIDNHGVPEGTLRPIVEELYYALANDLTFSEEESPLRFFVKEQNGKYVKVYNPNDLNYIERRNIVLAINRKLFSENSYYEKLRNGITKIVIENQDSDQGALFSLTKSLITELVNYGYDQRYIRNTLTYNYFNKKTPVISSIQIEEFFTAFSFEEKKFSITVIANESLENVLTDLPNIRIENRIIPKTRIPEERTFLQKSDLDKYFIFEGVEALDPYAAADSVKIHLSMRLSLYQLYDHEFNCCIEQFKFISYDEANYYTIIPPVKSPVQRMRTPKLETIQVKMIKAQQALQKRENLTILLLAANLHSLSLKSMSEENQILDLWAIIESVLNISQEHTSDRINQVCSCFIPVIKHQYLYSMLDQLLLDIKNYDEQQYCNIVGEETDSYNRTALLAKYISFEENRERCDAWLEMCVDFPLLKYRILKYRSFLQTRGALSRQIEDYSQKVRWQIMRAYRNRNLIIHNGETMPYTSLLVENLHAYVDMLLDYVVGGFAQGHSMRSIQQESFATECKWIECTEKNNSKITIDEDFIKYAIML